ncbi:MAG: type II toxin-antitoxin system prevent-host-death family antitoxin [Armatimonadetes bacterium]|nr:type II toxin-antitoxin system prevent-host-death family antitoxin [Armatimonadota bacterium]
MEKVGSYEAKTHLPKLLERVAKGERITITKHGLPVAMLVPVEPENARDIGKLIEEMLEFRKGRKLDGVSIRELIAEGRRF